MKRTKQVIVLCITLMFILALSACGGGTAQGANNPYGGVFTIEAIQDNPAAYVGTITLVGTVGSSGTQDFTLQNEAGTFEVHVDYRGSQSLPQVGDTIIVEGQLSANRPCCGPGFTIVSAQFEAVDN